jgi:hypothetical protein
MHARTLRPYWNVHCNDCKGALGVHARFRPPPPVFSCIQKWRWPPSMMAFAFCRDVGFVKFEELVGVEYIIAAKFLSTKDGYRCSPGMIELFEYADEASAMAAMAALPSETTLFSGYKLKGSNFRYIARVPPSAGALGGSMEAVSRFVVARSWWLAGQSLRRSRHLCPSLSELFSNLNVSTYCLELHLRTGRGGRRAGAIPSTRAQQPAGSAEGSPGHGVGGPSRAPRGGDSGSLRVRISEGLGGAEHCDAAVEPRPAGGVFSDGETRGAVGRLGRLGGWWSAVWRGSAPSDAPLKNQNCTGWRSDSCLQRKQNGETTEREETATCEIKNVREGIRNVRPASEREPPSKCPRRSW